MKGYFSFVTVALSLACISCSQQTTNYYVDIDSFETLRSHFAYSPKRDVVISGHRGGMVTGYPENCIESFEKTLTMMPSFFEIDPRLTKDGGYRAYARQGFGPYDNRQRVGFGLYL